MIILIILIPILGGIFSFFTRKNNVRLLILSICSLLHLVLSILTFFYNPESCLNGMLILDKVGKLFLLLMSFLFFMSTIYAISYLSNTSFNEKTIDNDGFIFDDSPQNIFISMLLIFCGTMSLVCVSNHVGFLWISIEATTFASAPLVYFYHTRSSLEATWKYVMICSVGIGLSLIGNLFLMLAFKNSGTNELTFTSISHYALNANKMILFTAFIFFVIGYGTKVGLAPMHTWLPSAHAEAPSFISSLLSGALLNCAFLGILRIQSICFHAGISEKTGKIMIFLGTFSVLTAALSMFSQNDYKKMLAFSSVEHMGIAIIAAGLGQKAAITASILHIINHSLTKASLFLSSGNILSCYRTKNINDVHSLNKKLPISSLLWLGGIFAICGLPPSGLFVTELMIFKEIFVTRKFFVAILLSLGLVILFGSMIFKVIEMYFSHDEKNEEIIYREKFLKIVPSFLLLLFTFILGFTLPGKLMDYINQISNNFGL